MKLDPARLAEYNEIRHPAVRHRPCHAPFVGMNFDQFGQASACCFNKVESLGRYPEQSIEEMWVGEPAERLRDSFDRQELGTGCEVCRLQIVSRNFHGTRALFSDDEARPIGGRRLIQPAGEGSRELEFPRTMEFELSNVCNLECVMCNGDFSHLIRKNREQRPALNMPYDDAFVDQLVPFLRHLTSLKFLGGEPFLIRVYGKIWDRVREINPAMQIHITTNGTIVNQQVRELLETLQCKLTVSVDSLRRDTYSKIRINADLDKVLDNMRFFLESCRRRGTAMGLSVCPMTLNWQEMPDFLRFGDRHDVKIYFNTVLSPRNLSLAGLDSETLTRILDEYGNVEQVGTTAATRTNGWRFDGLVRQLQGWKEMAVRREKQLKRARARPVDVGMLSSERRKHVRERAIEELIAREIDDSPIDPGADGSALYSADLPADAFVREMMEQMRGLSRSLGGNVDAQACASKFDAFERACRRIPESKLADFQQDIVGSDPLLIFRTLTSATPSWLVDQIENRYGRRD